jgi:hypothetical protein
MLWCTVALHKNCDERCQVTIGHVEQHVQTGKLALIIVTVIRALVKGFQYMFVSEAG